MQQQPAARLCYTQCLWSSCRGTARTLLASHSSAWPQPDTHIEPRVRVGMHVRVTKKIRLHGCCWCCCCRGARVTLAQTPPAARPRKTHSRAHCPCRCCCCCCCCCSIRCQLHKDTCALPVRAGAPQHTTRPQSNARGKPRRHKKRTAQPAATRPLLRLCSSNALWPTGY
jgi:hypothetical protein